MITVAIVNGLAVILAYFSRHKSMDFCLKLSFILLFTFLALRYNYGNDYKEYLNGFNEVNKSDIGNYSDESWYFEIGWLMLCRLFGPLGFFALVVALSLVNCIVYYTFIKNYVPKDYYWLAVFIYAFSPGLMVIQSSAMRQTLAINIFMYSFKFIHSRKWANYVLCICFASLFHTSALVLLPIYFISLFRWEINKAVISGLLALFVLAFVRGKAILSLMSEFTITYMPKYARYLGFGEAPEFGSGIGILYFTVIFSLILYYALRQEGEIAVQFKVSILFYLLLPLTFLLVMLGRIGMYLEPSTIVVIPIVFKSVRNMVFRNALMLILILMTLINFNRFFKSDTFKEAFGTYQTIFSSPAIY